MPTKRYNENGKCWYQWGSQTKYYFECGNEDAAKRAKEKADKQGQAAHISGYSAFANYIEFMKNNDNKRT